MLRPLLFQTPTLPIWLKVRLHIVVPVGSCFTNSPIERQCKSLGSACTSALQCCGWPTNGCFGPIGVAGPTYCKKAWGSFRIQTFFKEAGRRRRCKGHKVNLRRKLVRIEINWFIKPRAWNGETEHLFRSRHKIRVAYSEVDIVDYNLIHALVAWWSLTCSAGIYNFKVPIYSTLDWLPRSKYVKLRRFQENWPKIRRHICGWMCACAALLSFVGKRGTTKQWSLSSAPLQPRSVLRMFRHFV